MSIITTIDTSAEYDHRALRNALGSFATGVAIVTTCTPEGEWVGLTVNSFSSVSLEPPLVLWSQDLKSPSLAAFEQAAHYAVNVLSDRHEEWSNRFASRVADKFAGIDCAVGVAGVPLIPDCLAWFECRTAQRVVSGDHVILIGHVERFAHNPAPAPLMFQAGAYRRLAAG
jgi:flavin reductase (DIM6/NTAB) family NADH-FMN oxidoreductase RutF